MSKRTPRPCSQLPELRDRLHGELRSWRQALGAPVPTELNPDFEDPGVDAE